MKTKIHAGPFFAICSALLFGLSTPFAKILLGDIIPTLLAGILYLGSGLGILIIFSFRHISMAQSERSYLKKKDFTWLFGATLFGGLLGPIFLMVGLNLSAASTSALLLNLEGVMTSAIAWFVFKEHFNKRIVYGMAAIVIGGVILSWQPGAEISSFKGPLFIILACASWAIDNNFTRNISASDPYQITMIKSLVASIINISIALYLGIKFPDLNLVLKGASLGFLGYGLSIVLFVFALRSIGTSRTGAYFSSAPFIGAIVSIFIFHEEVTLKLLVASFFMAYGLYLHLTEDHAHSHEHLPHEHSHHHVHDEHHTHEHLDSDPAGEAHTHKHFHKRMTHSHPHYPDIHHQHKHKH